MHKTRLAALALAISFAGCAHAQQPPAQSGVTQMPTETVTFSQPPVTAWVGFSASARNGGRMVVTGVREGSPAAAAGFAPGDMILSVNGRDALEHPTNFRTLTPGQRYTVRVKRGSEERDLVLVPAPPQAAPARP